MKTKRPFKNKTGALIKTIKENKRILLVALVLCAGIAIGVYYSRYLTGASGERLHFLIDGFINKKSGQSFFSRLFSSYLSDLFLVAIIFFAGFCAIGTPAIPFVILFKGLGIGLSTGFLYATAGTKGFIFSLVFIVPRCSITCFALLLASCEGIRLSGQILKQIKEKRNNGKTAQEVKLYIIRFVFVAMLCLAAALLDTILTALLKELLIL